MNFDSFSPSIAILASLLTAGFILAVRNFARRLQIISTSGGRRIERRPIPLIGGFSIFCAVFCSLFFANPNPQVFVVVALSLPILLLGILDDTVELDAKRKLPLEVICSLGWVFYVNPSDLILVQAGLPILAAQILTGFWILGVTNALNLSDGIDGLVAGLSAVVCAVLVFAAPASVFTPLWLVLIFSLFGFLPFNFSGKFKTFLGDGGSLWLGFILSCTASVTKISSYPLWDALAMMSLFCYSEFDTLYAVFRRVKSSMPVMTGDHFHIHHQVRQLGFRPVTSSAIIISVNACVSLSFVFAAWLNQPVAAFLTCGIALLTFVVITRASLNSRSHLRKAGSELVATTIYTQKSNVIAVNFSDPKEKPLLVASIDIDRMFETIPLLSDKTVLEATVLLKALSNEYTADVDNGKLRFYCNESQGPGVVDKISEQLKVGLKMQRKDDGSILTFASFYQDTKTAQPTKAA